MCSAAGSILGLIVGGQLYGAIGVNYTMDIYVTLSLLMAVLFFLMNIWPGFLLAPRLEDIPEPNLTATMSVAEQQKVRLTRAVQEALEDKTSENRIINSIRGSCAADLIFPVTNEQKIYLAGIDEEEEDSDDSGRF